MGQTAVADRACPPYTRERETVVSHLGRVRVSSVGCRVQGVECRVQGVSHLGVQFAKLVGRAFREGLRKAVGAIESQNRGSVGAIDRQDRGVNNMLLILWGS